MIILHNDNGDSFELSDSLKPDSELIRHKNNLTVKTFLSNNEKLFLEHFSEDLEWWQRFVQSQTGINLNIPL